MSKKIQESVVSTKSNMMAEFTKWVPLICAGAAVGVSLIALKEIKNIKNEFVVIKNEPRPVPVSQPPPPDSRIQAMDEQIKKITEYIKNNQTNGIIKNAIPVSPKKNVKIINEPEILDPEEFEEVEVTDSEGED